ncbi:MAG: 1-acyl-sn-glycerol-3-phosphate acyltransferase [Spirochaetia bacterium]|nr:1-acyl-sn-glycerol-3-phosphate acyltransferase [Spirochaetia bacterium]
MSDMTVDEFYDIRPYEGKDFTDALGRLLENRDLISAFRKQVFPNIPKFMGQPFDRLCHIYLKSYLGKVQTPNELHKKILVKLIDFVIKSTMTGYSETGSENLTGDKNYLYISNHRDIAMDPVIIVYKLLKKGFPCFQVAFGDNLLGNQTVSDAIRVNKAFIVKRDVAPMEQMKTSMQLSRYIRETIQNKDSIWIAQREGRAKDGDDKTNPAIIKMFALCNRQTGLTFSQFINSLNITPVAVSYEFDPCDRLKAREAVRRAEKAARDESYVKRSSEDKISIVLGIKGKKGRVHVSYGQPLCRESWKNAREVAEAIDQFVLTNYKLWPCNYLSYDMVNETDKYSSHYTAKYKKDFLKRFRRLPENVRKVALQMYAKPVENAEKYAY